MPRGVFFFFEFEKNEKDTNAASRLSMEIFSELTEQLAACTLF